jgi:hypothetical protein
LRRSRWRSIAALSVGVGAFQWTVIAEVLDDAITNATHFQGYEGAVSLGVKPLLVFSTLASLWLVLALIAQRRVASDGTVWRALAFIGSQMLLAGTLLLLGIVMSPVASLR